MIILSIALFFSLCSIIHCNLPIQYPLENGVPFNGDKYLARAENLMKKYPMIDGHNVFYFLCRIDNKDFPMLLRFGRNDSIYSNFSFEETLPGDTDIPRLRKGLVGGQFWSVFIPWYNPRIAC